MFSIINAQNAIDGIWYRNDLFAKATLEIRNFVFEIKATNTAHEGKINGKMEKLKDGVFYSIVEDRDYYGKCLLVFEENKNQVYVSTYGERIGAGFTVYYDGEYDIKEITQEQFRQKALDYIVGKRIDYNIVFDLVKDDLDYFIECFERVNDYKKDTNIEYTISGILPGAALYQKGVLLVNNGEIAILFLDCRTKPMSYKYYTNGSTEYYSYLSINDWIQENGNLQVIEKK